MIYFLIILSFAVGLIIGLYLCPRRDDAMIKEAKRCQQELKQMNSRYAVLSYDYSESLIENARLNNKLAARINYEK